MNLAPTPDLQERLLAGLERLASVLRADARKSSAPHGLNPAQDALLRLLLSRPAGLRVRALAEHLGVRQPTITDSAIALERKGLVSRLVDPADARATLVRATPRASQQGRGEVRNQAAAALADLSEADQITLLNILIKVIRSLQFRGAIPPQRLCVTCKYFRPNVHPDEDTPHHCAFVDAPFGDRALRLDCAEHEQAGFIEMAQNWDIFLNSSSHDEAQP
jgi:DNA-binding MarR family transcriptional regulator